ncbi:MAG: ATPase [Cyclobacteriaceae bacterium]|nr:ATPase [Cyclobacteriaceae bacterium]
MKNLFYKIQILVRWLKRNITDRVIGQTRFWTTQILQFAYRGSNMLLPLATLAAFCLIVYDFGFHPFYNSEAHLARYLFPVLSAFKILFLIRFVSGFIKLKAWRAHVYALALVILAFYLPRIANEVETLAGTNGTGFLIKKLMLYGFIIFLFITEASGLLKYLYRRRQNTAFVFIISFVVIIVLGGLLLLLPTATVNGISVVDAFFTSASAVCVTGLTTLNTAYDFTSVGKIIILLLIQVGGLGIMTFTGLLAYLAAGSVSFHNQVALKSMVSSNRISNVISIVGRIIMVTFFFEAIGALLIYFSMDSELFDRQVEHVFFSVFHAISAFCNAGFSTLPDGLNTSSVKFNYPLHLILAMLIVLGGMGFPIVFNIFSYFRRKVVRLINRLLHNPIRESQTRIIQVNSKIALWTSLILLVVGMACYFIFEYDASLQEHTSVGGKIVTAVFGSVTPRTAGFNTVNMQALTLPTVMIYLLLMWIGASPSSTGGGIKTTTIAVAFLNLRALLTGNNRMEVFRTQISETSINRAFAVIFISLIIIGIAVLLISVSDPQFALLEISFEVFSAFSTVGLTLGLTPQLSASSKIILIVTMFIGRVGSLTLLMALAAQSKKQLHQYPVEEIMY